MWHPKAIYKLILRLGLHASRWDYGTRGYCSSCGGRNFFLYAKEAAGSLAQLISDWGTSEGFNRQLVERENYFCCFCSSNFRKRALAQTILELLSMDTVHELVRRLVSDKNFMIYETASYNIFRLNRLKTLANYQVSEFFPEQRFGELFNGIRNENLEALTFDDNQFDLVITSDVLEHVGDIDAALLEIYRVLKPGGYHVFTVPVDMGLPLTRERAVVGNNGIEYVLPPVIHGDTIRDEGILAFRDFGADIVSKMSRDGFVCQERQVTTPLQQSFSVYFARKSE